MGFFDFFKRKGSAEDRQQQQKKEEEKTKGISKPFTEMGFAELEEVVDGIDDQQALFEIVTRPQIIGTAEEKVLKKAMRRLTDPELLDRISVMENRPYAARLAVQSGRLSQESTARIAKFGYDPVIKLDAARQLYNTNLIVDALVTQPSLHDDTVEYSRIVNTLVGKLNHPADLQRVIDNAESRWVASCAERKLATIPIPDKDEPSARDGDGNLIHMHYADAELAKVTDAYITRYGLNGLSKQEAELARPFFAHLFSYYHNNAVTYNHSERCDRNDCSLVSNQPVFQTASRTLCKDCALQYIIGNARDWYYYLGNYSAHAGYIPPSLEREAAQAREQIAALRDSVTDNMSDQELLKFIQDDSRDRDARAKAVGKIKDLSVLDQAAQTVSDYPVVLKILDHDISQESLLKILDSVRRANSKPAGEIRKKATLKLSEENLEAVLEGEVPGAIYYAIMNIEDKYFLERYIETTERDDNRETAKKRLEELNK